MNAPENCRYTMSDEWLREDGDLLTLGITDFAQHEMGEIVYLELPEVGARVTVGAAWGVVESVKAVAELLSPLEGEVVEVNAPLQSDPSLINSSPFEDGWMIRVRPSAPPQDAMDAAAYIALRA